MSAVHESPSPIAFSAALRFWLKLGFISFGGPAGQIAIMHQELVERRRWLSERRFLHALNYCMVLPGPEAQQLATYLGWLMHRSWGGIVAGVLFVLPSLFLLIALSWIYVAFGDVPWVAGLFQGIKPAVIAIVLQAAHRIGSRTLRNPLLWAVAMGSFIAIFIFNLPFPLIVLGAALVGYVSGRIAPELFAIGSANDKVRRDHGPALIDDDMPPTAHTRPQPGHLLRIAAIGVALWVLPMVALMTWQGWHGTFTQMGWFFTKAALLTFGGAYAALPYVYQGAVSSYGWLTAQQMIDGLALGETTPGPLIMVVVFVAFVGGYGSAAFGPELRFASGALAAVMVAWFTFLPSFLFILIGGPLVESTHGSIRLTAPLTAITAAVVGVIVSLALFLAYHVLWPIGFSGSFAWVTALLSVAGAIALFKFKRTVIEVIVASALLGLLLSLMH